MRRYRKLVLVAAALVSALFLTIHRRRGAHDRLGLVLDTADPSSADPGARPGGQAAYDLTTLRDTMLTLERIKDDYVDPTRIDPKAMLLAALDNVQKEVAEVLIAPSADKRRVTVQVLDAKQTFDISGVDAPWKLASTLKAIFQFIQPNLAPGADKKELQDIEYAAINGMLSTLDPHSTLLDPQTYDEMKISTRGSFGGIGVTLGLRKGDLTVINVLPGDTPANKVGLRANDRIMVINDESTVNMTLQDAVERLRGDPGTPVRVRVARNGTDGLLPLTLVRAVIQVPNVQAHLLDGGVGYIKVGTPTTGFAQNTADELHDAIVKLKAQGAHAWVMDLRDNPGGLLDQAIKVADEFVKDGTIVTTVGFGGKKREEKHATGRGGEPGPMAVLVDGYSASASEIVAGALKNLDRAVIIGQRTFGKGSVQILYDNDDGSALKLTIAQYLTPGDISIQSVGITPDIALDPVHVPSKLGSYKDVIQLFTRPKVRHEWDLDAHLTQKTARHNEQPLERLSFLEPATDGGATAAAAPGAGKAPAPAPRHGKAGHGAKGKVSPQVAAPPVSGDDATNGDDEEEDGEDTPSPSDDEFDAAKWKPDREVTFAADLVSHATASKRSDVIAQSRELVAQAEKSEETKIDEALGKLGIDWSAGTPAGGGAAHLAASLSSNAGQGKATAGQIVTLHASVTNGGSAPAYRVHGTLKTDDPTFQDREFLFGVVKPGETRTFDVPVRIWRDAIDRVDALDLELGDAAGDKAAPAELKLAVASLPQPVFAYGYQILDDAPHGNGDGLVQVGESPTLRVTVKNIGAGRSWKTEATLADKSGDGVNIDKGRFALDDMRPGESRTIDFTFDVTPDYGKDSFDLELSVYDRTLSDYVTEKLHFPIAPAGAAATPEHGQVSVARAGAEIRGGASAEAPVIGRAPKGAAFAVSTLVNGFYRVALAGGRPGFVSASDAALGGQSGAPAAQGFAPELDVSPPLITLAADHGVETAADTYPLAGTARGESRVRDLFIFVQNQQNKIYARKVYYTANDKAANPARLDFTTAVPLWPGSNYITVVARKNGEVESRTNLVVYRDPPPGWVAPADKDDLPDQPLPAEVLHPGK